MGGEKEFIATMFQSTRPHGARHYSAPDTTPPRRFNPRARMGRDFLIMLFLFVNQRFNPRARMGRDCICTNC